jgi:hypothetical protein
MQAGELRRSLNGRSNFGKRLGILLEFSEPVGLSSLLAPESEFSVLT